MDYVISYDLHEADAEQYAHAKILLDRGGFRDTVTLDTSVRAQLPFTTAFGSANNTNAFALRDAILETFVQNDIPVSRLIVCPLASAAAVWVRKD